MFLSIILYYLVLYRSLLYWFENLLVFKFILNECIYYIGHSTDPHTNVFPLSAYNFFKLLSSLNIFYSYFSFFFFFLYIFLFSTFLQIYPGLLSPPYTYVPAPLVTIIFFSTILFTVQLSRMVMSYYTFLC